MKRGLALIIVVGILGVLAVLAAAFVMMAQLERRASEQRVNAARAYLLARSGIEDALARLELGQDAVYAGEDYDDDGSLDPGLETESQVYRPSESNREDCPARHALRPSFFVRNPAGSPALLDVDGRKRGYTGKLSGEAHHYALKVQSSNAGIFVNGGALDELDRDPDGPNAPPEAAPLDPNGIPDYRDASMEGPNGFLVRLLNNLDATISNGATSDLGALVVGARPLGGYTSLDQLPERARAFRPYLTLHAWVDPKVVKPQPMDGRPYRWQDVDDTHRLGREALPELDRIHEISGVHFDPTPGVFLGPNGSAVTGTTLSLEPGLAGSGTPGDPWVRTIRMTNGHEGSRGYPVRWERGFVYAWHQLRPGLPAMEPRAPIPLDAPEPLLASVFPGLKGTWLEVWDGSGGWDGGFGWMSWNAGDPVFNTHNGAVGTYAYPSRTSEDTPWHRTRLDYGMTYGAGRPWYAPLLYQPHAPGAGGKPLVQAAPLGRLRETPAITPAQALGIAGTLGRRMREEGPIRTWARFNRCVDALPGWEDLDGDDLLDGQPYAVGEGAGAYTRRVYRLEDLDSDGAMDRGRFPGGAPGLTFVQKDVVKAMANPNTDLNDFNPDANLFKEVDKLDLLHHTTELALQGAPAPCRLRSTGRTLGKDGRLLAGRSLTVLGAPSGRIHRDTAQADFMRGYAEGAREIASLFEPPEAPYPFSGGQALVSHPEPQTVAAGLPLPGAAGLPGLPPLQQGRRAADAAYDGQIALGFIAPHGEPGGVALDRELNLSLFQPGSMLSVLNLGKHRVTADAQPFDETLRGDLFDSADAVASGDPAFPDLRGPFQAPLAHPAEAGNVFPDGVYAERDRALKYLVVGNFQELPASAFNALVTSFYVACWAKPAWRPEATPRPHALVSLSRACEPGQHVYFTINPYGVPVTVVPVDDILLRPAGLYFVPARNNLWEGAMGNYVHDASSTRGRGWPRRSLLWGTVHNLWASDALNHRGIGAGAGGPQRLEARRWQHLAMVGQVATLGLGAPPSELVVGRVPASATGTGPSAGFGIGGVGVIRGTHADGSPHHLRFGEVSGAHNMNYAADATFANVRASSRTWALAISNEYAAFRDFFTSGKGPAALGRYVKESGAAYVSPPLPEGIRFRRATWTEIPCDLWFDEDGDGWMDALRNDRDGNGLRDVRIALEVWDDRGRLARFDDTEGDNRIPPAVGRLFYKAVFVNEWDAATRANHPLDVTPFLDDVTVYGMDPMGPVILAWGDDED